MTTMKDLLDQEVVQRLSALATTASVTSDKVTADTEIDPRSEAMLDAACDTCGCDLLVQPQPVPEEYAHLPRKILCAPCAKAYLTGRSGRVIHKPQVAKHPWRVTDGREHPVVTTHQKEHDMPKINLTDLTDAELGALMREQLLAQVEADAPAKQKAAKAKKAKGEKAAAKAAKAERDQRKAAKPLPAFTYGNHVDVPALDLSEVTSLDEVVPATLRSPYNKARFHIEGSAALPSPQACEDDATLTPTTYAVIAAEHVRLAELAEAKTAAKAQAEIEKAAAAKGKGKKAKGKKKAVAAVLNADDKAKAAKVAALMATLNCDEATALGVLASI